MSEPDYQTFILDWSGIRIAVRYCRNWLDFHERLYGYPLAHLEIESIDPENAPLPMTGTGYRSHIARPDMIEAQGGAVPFVRGLPKQPKTRNGSRRKRSANSCLYSNGSIHRRDANAGRGALNVPLLRTIGPKVFVSSVYREPSVLGSEKHLKIRRTIHDIAGDMGIDAWIAEYSAKGLEKRHWTEIVDQCVENLLEAQVLIAVLYTRAGGAVQLDSEFGFSAASIFEIELFYASLRLKPAFFFIVRGYEPEPELENLIRLLRIRETTDNWFIGTEAEIESRIRELFALFIKGTIPNAALPNFCDLESEFRSFRQIEREIHSEKLSLVNRFAPVDSTDYARDRIDHLLGLAKSAPSQPAKFSRLWMALRELCKRPFDETDRTAADQWLELSRRMPSIGAWLGLHGPLNVGVIAAYQTQNELRRRAVLADELFPYGAFASESYSIGINHVRPGWKRLRFRAAERLATRHAELHPRDPSGALAIRGSARLRLARLGRPWLVWSALDDFKQACKIKERLGADAAGMGEAILNRGLAEYAVSRLLWYKRRGALDMMREGVRNLETGKSAGRIGFIVSAKRKLADALKDSGLMDEARKERDEAEALAKEFGIIGQLGRLPDI